MGSQGERWMRQPQWEMPSATGQGRDRSSRNLPTEAATEAPSAPPHPQGGTGSVRGSGGRRSARPCPPAPRPPSAASAARYCRQPSGRATTRSPQELLSIVEKSSSRKGREAGETGAGTVCGGTDGTAGLAGAGGGERLLSNREETRTAGTSPSPPWYQSCLHRAVIYANGNGHMHLLPIV